MSKSSNELQKDPKIIPNLSHLAQRVLGSSGHFDSRGAWSWSSNVSLRKLSATEMSEDESVELSPSTRLTYTDSEEIALQMLFFLLVSPVPKRRNRFRCFAY